MSESTLTLEIGFVIYSNLVFCMHIHCHVLNEFSFRNSLTTDVTELFIQS